MKLKYEMKSVSNKILKLFLQNPLRLLHFVSRNKIYEFCKSCCRNTELEFFIIEDPSNLMSLFKFWNSRNRPPSQFNSIILEYVQIRWKPFRKVHQCNIMFFDRICAPKRVWYNALKRLTAISFLTLSWRRSISYRNQSIDLRSKSMDSFLYDISLRHERVNWIS